MLPMGTRLRNPRRSLVSSAVSVPVSSYAPWSPLALQPTLWLDASDLTTITATSGAVSEWRDKSGNGYAFTQASSTAQPTTGSTTQNGLNVLSFDGGDALVSTAAASEWIFFHDGTKHLVGVVAKRNVSSVNSSIFHTYIGTTDDGVGVRWNLDNFSHFVANTTVNPVVINNSAAGTSTATRLLSIFSDPSNSIAANRSSMWIDNGSEQSLNTVVNAVSNTAPASTLYVGNRNSANWGLNGTIAEIVVVTGTSATYVNRQRLHNYLNAKWAVY